MLNCNDIKKLINKYIDGELDENLRSSFDEHIDSCKECKQELEETFMVVNLLNDIPDSELPEGFETSLHEKLLSVKPEAENKVVSLFGRRYVKVISGLAAAMLVFVFAWGVSKVDFDLFSLSSTAPYNSSSVNENSGDNDSQKNLNSDTIDKSSKENDKNEDPDTSTNSDDMVSPGTDFSTPNPGFSNDGAYNEDVPKSHKIIQSTPNMGITGDIYGNAFIKVTSADFDSDYAVISGIAKNFEASVERNATGEQINLQIAKSKYDEFLSSIKKDLGESNISEETVLPNSSISEDSNNDEKLVCIVITLVK